MTDEQMTPERVLALAEQARLGVTEEEARELAPRLQTVLDRAARLARVDVGDAAPLLHGVDRTNVLREDVVGPSLSNEEALAGAPEVQDGFFKVPRLHEQ